MKREEGIPMSPAALVIADTAIRCDAAGRYCLNDLHRAAGGEKRHQPTDWLRIRQTQDLIGEMCSTPGIPGVGQTLPVEVVNGGASRGTYVVKELVYAYAMWVSPAFHLKVIRAYDALVTSAPPVDPLQALNDPATMRTLLLGYSEKVLALEHKVDTLAPKAEALDRFATFAEGTLCIWNAAKALQVRPKKLFEWLHAHHWIYRRNGGSSWLAYQTHIQAGHLEHKVTTLTRDDGTEKVVEQVRVTAKGLAKLAALLGGGGGPCEPA